MNNSRQIKIGAILSYTQMGLGIVVNLLYIPLMIRILGQAEYGLYSVVSSTISIRRRTTTSELQRSTAYF